MNRRRFLASASVLAASGALAAPALIQSEIVIGRGRYDSPCDGVGDDTDAVNLAIADIINAGTNPGNVRIQLPTRVATGPIIRPDCHQFTGQGPTATKWTIRAPVPGTPGGRYFLDFSNPRPGMYGGGVQGLAIEASEHSAGVTLIALNVPPGGQPPANNRFADLRLGGLPMGAPAWWLPYRHIQFLGRQDTSPLGLRQLTLARISCFGATSGDSIWIDGLVAGSIEDVACFPAGAGSRFTAVRCEGTSARGLNLQGGYQFGLNVNSSFVSVGGTLL